MIPQTPQEAIEMELKASEEYSRLSDRFSELEVLKAQYFETNFEGFGGKVNVVDRKWAVTSEGQEMTKTYRKLKALEKEISSMKTYLKHKENEAKNVY